MSEDGRLKAHVHVDASDWQGELCHNWNYIGTDECNFIHEPEGEALLAAFGQFAEKPYYVRPHHLFCTGNCRGFLKWGSTNVYTEDKEGNPVYDFTTFDKIFDTILRTGCKPFVELGFMPFDLVDKSYAKYHGDEMGSYNEYKRIGWACPPKDYNRWRELISTVVRHLVERYGADEVKTWYFELWNEPDLTYYWKGSVEDFCKLYDYTVAGIEDVLPGARIGGPATTGPMPGSRSANFLDEFLNHCQKGKNYVTGETGTRLDFITFHVKGGGFPFSVRPEKGYPTVHSMVRQVACGLDIIEKNGYADLEIVLSEADPDGWAAGGMYDNINLFFRNTPYYASFVAASFHHIQQLAEARGADVRPLSWAFVFPGERCFEGTRAFQTQGIDKAIFNLFRMYALVGDRKIGFESSAAANFKDCFESCNGYEQPEVNGFAAMSGDNSIDILVYCHHDDMWDKKPGYQVALEITNVPFLTDKVKVLHYRIDENHSNAYAVWKAIGRPDYPTPGQVERMKSRAGLEMLCPPQEMGLSNGTLSLNFDLPVSGVSLIRVQRVE